MFLVTEQQETIGNATDKPLQAATTISVDYTDGDTTIETRVETTKVSVYDSDLGSSTRKIEQILDTEMNTYTVRPLDENTTPINSVEITLETAMNSTFSVDDDIPQNEFQDTPENLVNDTEINFSATEKSETTENSDGKTVTITEPKLLVNDKEIDVSVHTPETDRLSSNPSEIFNTNVTVLDITTFDALETTNDSVNDAQIDVTIDRPSEIFGINDTNLELTTAGAIHPGNDTKTEEITVALPETSTYKTPDARQETTVNSENDTEEVTIYYPQNTMTSNETEELQTTTDNFPMDLRPMTESNTDPDIDNTTHEPRITTVKLDNDSDITEPVDTRTIGPRPYTAKSNSVNGTETELQTPKTGPHEPLADQGKSNRDFTSNFT